MNLKGRGKPFGSQAEKLAKRACEGFRIWLGYSKQMQYPVPTVNAIKAHKELEQQRSILKLLAEHLSLSRCWSFEQTQSNCSKKQMPSLQWCALECDVKFSSKCNASLLRGSESCQMQPQWFILPLSYINHGLCLEWNSCVLLTVYCTKKRVCFWLWQSHSIISMEGDAKKSYMRVTLNLYRVFCYFSNAYLVPKHQWCIYYFLLYYYCQKVVYLVTNGYQL